MTTKKLQEIAELSFGKNGSRMTKEEEEHTYSIESLEEDLHYVGPITKSGRYSSKIQLDEGDLVIRLINPKVAVVSPKSAGSYLSMNFAKIIPDPKQADGWYLCYCFNESPVLQKQLLIQANGQSLVKRISSRSLKNLEIKLPDLDTQKKLGKIYRNWLNYRFESEKLLDQQEALIMNAIEKECE